MLLQQGSEQIRQDCSISSLHISFYDNIWAGYRFVVSPTKDMEQGIRGMECEGYISSITRSLGIKNILLLSEIASLLGSIGIIKYYLQKTC